MGLFRILRLAVTVDRMTEGRTPPPVDPAIAMLRQMEYGVYEQFAKIEADRRVRAKRLTEMRGIK